MLRQKNDRTLHQNLLLASSTAFVSGVTNIVGMIAFLAFTTNITGHVTNLARHVVEQNFREEIVFVTWLLLFFTGAFASNFIVRSFEHKSRYRAHSIPIIIEIILLLFVAVYGHSFYSETDLEREIIIGCIIFSMGMQNNLVSTISGGLIKSTHLTGLFTDLGGDVSEWLHPGTGKSKTVRNKIIVRLTILAFYFAGAVFGAYFFNLYDFAIFYFIPLILLTILYYDLSPVALHKLSRVFWADKNGED